jgi:outer membrane protein assembly factor BamB
MGTRHRTARHLAAASSLVLLVALGACSDDGGSDATTGDDRAADEAAPPTTTTAADLPSVTPFEDAGALAIEATPDPDWVAITGDAAWVTGVGEGEVGIGEAMGDLARYDLTTGELGGITPIGVACLAMEEAFASLWVADCADSTLQQVDPDTAEVVSTTQITFTNQVAPESSIGATRDALWLLSAGDEPSLAKVDPETLEVEVSAAPAGAAAVRGTDDAVWVTDADDDQLVQIDPDTGDEVGRTDVSSGPGFLAVDDTDVWVLGADHGTVSRVDQATGDLVAEVVVDEAAVTGGDIAVGGGFVWARTVSSAVAQIDPATNEVVARFGEPVGSGSVAAGEHAVWISAHDVTTVWRLPLP